jgi:hypothetical protein
VKKNLTIHLFVIVFCFYFSFAIAGETLTGEIIESGRVTAFDEEYLLDGNSQAVFCETSAVIFDGEKIIFGSDRPLPGEERSSVFSFPLIEGEGFDLKNRSYYLSRAFKEAVKYEDFTITPDKKTILATTSFDRFNPEQNLDGYNTLLAWPRGNESAVVIVDPYNRENFNSSLGLRGKMRKAMVSKEYPEGPEYFKVEGLAAIPGNTLLFGIAEVGINHMDFKPSIKILAVQYSGEGVSFQVEGEFREVYDSSSEVHSVLGRQVSLSGMEYDKFNDRILLLTSYDDKEAEELKGDERIGGYLWYLTIENLEHNRAPSFVHDEENQPMRFSHKPEGLTVLDSSIILIVHDDDSVLGRKIIDDSKTQFSRKANEGFCDVVRINTINSEQKDSKIKTINDFVMGEMQLFGGNKKKEPAIR